MKKRIPLIAVVIAVATLAAAPLAMAGPGRGGRHGFGGPAAHGFGHGFGIFGHLRQAKEELDLSDQQIDQLKAIFEEVHELNAPYRDQLHDGLREAAEALLANPNDIAGAQALIDGQIAAERAVRTNLLNATSKALNVLTAEQRTKLSAMLADHEAHRGRRGR